MCWAKDAKGNGSAIHERNFGNKLELFLENHLKTSISFGEKIITNKSGKSFFGEKKYQNGKIWSVDG